MKAGLPDLARSNAETELNAQGQRSRSQREGGDARCPSCLLWFVLTRNMNKTLSIPCIEDNTMQFGACFPLLLKRSGNTVSVSRQLTQYRKETLTAADAFFDSNGGQKRQKKLFEH